MTVIFAEPPLRKKHRGEGVVVNVVVVRSSER